jgi:site-specific DNA-cytosine methylase
MTFIDLFCGIGGFSYGFARAGFEHKLGIDFDPNAIKTYNLNFSGGGLLKDIKDVDFKPLCNKIDVVIGSPPCQSFSSANVKSRTCDTTLTTHFFRAIDEVKPKVWVMENVPSVIDFIDAPYKYVFQMSDYGLLQKRRRCIASNTELELPKPAQKYLTEEHIAKLKEFRKEAIHRKFQTVTCRYNSYSKTNPHFVEDDGRIRLICHEEAMAIQSFPFDYKLADDLTQRETEMLIGNAVPPAFAYKVARWIITKNFLH